MKTLLLLLTLSFPFFAKAKDKDNGYTTSIGWKIQPGDELAIGKGTLPTKKFAFIYQSPDAFFQASNADGSKRRTYLPSSMSGQHVKIKRFIDYGNERTGYTKIAVVNIGELSNYWIEIDNALEAGEIIPPDEYKARLQLNKPVVTSVADELKKLKALRDDSTLTEEEFQAQKKKLLNQ